MIAGVLLCIAMVGRTQAPAWKGVKIGSITLKYPPGWQVDSGRDNGEANITLTPDSMQNLNMRMCVIFAMPADSANDYSYLEQHFTAMVESSLGPDVNFLKTADTTFKGHKCMYAEVTLRALPMKIYAFNEGAYHYVILFTLRRNWQVADPRLERDEAGILNSLSFGH